MAARRKIRGALSAQPRDCQVFHIDSHDGMLFDLQTTSQLAAVWYRVQQVKNDLIVNLEEPQAKTPSRVVASFHVKTWWASGKWGKRKPWEFCPRLPSTRSGYHWANETRQRTHHQKPAGGARLFLSDVWEKLLLTPRSGRLSDDWATSEICLVYRFQVELWFRFTSSFLSLKKNIRLFQC